MKPVSTFPVKEISAVFSDLDDTLTDASRMRRETYDAIWELKDKNIPVIIVSGRPAGWADCLMRLWPIEAMIFENGAGVITRDGEKNKVHALVPPGNRERLEEVFTKLKKVVPAAKKSTDQPYRLYDMAVDFAEEPPFLTEEQIQTLLSTLKSFPDVTAKLSSIHINYWIGQYTKQTACEYLLNFFKWETKSVLYCGDSPNDEPLFGFFENSVGVANIEPYLSQLTMKPKYLCAQKGGAGFCEIARALLQKT